MKAYLDKDTCISCGLCPSICPEVFEMQDDGKAGICASVGEHNNVVPKEVEDSTKESAEACPVAAITTE